MVLKILLSILGFFVAIQILLRIFKKVFRSPAPVWITRFLDSSLRKKMQPPETIISRSGIRKGMTVLEVGCGSGAYTLDVAKAVGKDGEVYAVDIQKEMLEQLRKKLGKAENQSIGNIRITEANARDLPYGKDFFDLVYMITVLQEIPERQRALEEIYRVLKPEGIIAVSEFLTDPDYPLRSTTKKQLERAGFIVEEVAGSFFSYTARERKGISEHRSD